MFDIFVLGLIALFIYYLFLVIFQKRIPNNTILVFNGTMGSGKSFLGVKQTIKHYRKIRLLKLLKLIPKNSGGIYSNIPITYGKKYFLFGPNLWAERLTLDHLTGYTKLPEYVSIFFDEVGDVTDQYKFNNPIVQEFIQKFTRYARHWLDPQLVLATQSLDDIAKPIRSKISQVYYLKDFKRKLLFFYYVSVYELQAINDDTTISKIDTTNEYFFGFPLPFKYLKTLNKILFPFSHKLYDSRCYSITYQPKNNLLVNNSWSNYKTKYIIDVPTIPQLNNLYKKNGFITYDQLDILKKQQQNNKNNA